MNEQSMKVDVSFPALREICEHARDTDAAATAHAQRTGDAFDKGTFQELLDAAHAARRDIRSFMTFDVLLVLLDAIETPVESDRCEYRTGGRQCTNPRRLHPEPHTMEPVRKGARA